MSAEITMQHGHALLQVKRADAEARTIRGIASTPTTDRQGDILEPMGATFALPLPLLWQHDHGQPIGQITDARATAQGIVIFARIAPEGTSERIDEAWRLIRAGLVSGLSVGFRGLDWEQLPNGGRQFTKWEIIETSCVTIPANAEARITEVKRADALQPEASGVPSYPAHLSEPERQAVLERAARSLYTLTIAETAHDQGVTEHDLRKRFGPEREAAQLAQAETAIRQRWLEERIARLEAHIKGERT